MSLTFIIVQVCDKGFTGNLCQYEVNEVPTPIPDDEEIDTEQDWPWPWKCQHIWAVSVGEQKYMMVCECGPSSNSTAMCMLDAVLRQDYENSGYNESWREHAYMKFDEPNV